MTRPTNGMAIVSDTAFPPGTYLLPNGISIEADGVTLDGNGATLVGADRNGCGITVSGRSNVTIRNVRLRDYYHGIRVRNARGVTIAQNQITSTAEVAANTVFLDIWRGADNPYGGAILLEHVENSEIVENDVQHQLCGLLTYHCRELTVRRNLASYNSGYGIHLFHTSDSLFEANYADYCCRYEPRGHGYGHMGADATGFLIVNDSCRNVFRGNFARLGGDGFFLAGRTASGEAAPCNDNLFEENDGSHSPNIAFEATFSAGNKFRGNKADRCNYGFWLGFSSETVLENNSLIMNRQAGIAVENGRAFVVRGNDFQRNGAGILLWSKYVKDWYEELPENRTVHHWTLDGNTLTHNGTGITIAADRDHGIRPMPPEASGRPELRPHDNAIRGNDIQDNRIGIDLHRTNRTIIENNTVNRNVEADIRQDDTAETTIRNNLGAAGAYL